MVAYSFQRRFEAPIAADIKLQTIRGPRKRHAQPGEDLQLYVGMRTKHCRLVGRRRTRSIHDVVIDVASGTILVGEAYPAGRLGIGFDYELNSRTTRLAEVLDRDQFAVRDGFADWADMRAFWIQEHALAEAGEMTAFHGVLIAWLPGELVHPEACGVAPIARELEALGL